MEILLGYIVIKIENKNIEYLTYDFDYNDDKNYFFESTSNSFQVCIFSSKEEIFKELQTGHPDIQNALIDLKDLGYYKDSTMLIEIEQIMIGGDHERY
jgi:hypothetical protein